MSDFTVFRTPLRRLTDTRVNTLSDMWSVTYLRDLVDSFGSELSLGTNLWWGHISNNTSKSSLKRRTIQLIPRRRQKAEPMSQCWTVCVGDAWSIACNLSLDSMSVLCGQTSVRQVWDINQMDSTYALVVAQSAHPVFGWPSALQTGRLMSWAESTSKCSITRVIQSTHSWYEAEDIDGM